MINKRWTQFGTSAVLSLAILTVFVQGAARAQDDEDKNSIWNMDKRLIDGFARGLGLKSPNDRDIEYRERSPLVVPPSRDLPPPQVEGANHTGDWPVDPDQQRRKAAAIKKRPANSRAMDEDYQMRNLNPSELGGSDPTGTVTARRGRSGDNADKLEGANEQPSQLGYFGGIFSWNGLWGGKKEEFGTFTKEPPRSSLTEPPVGYQTPSAEQPYGVSKEKVRQKVTPLDPAVGNLGN
jgi:hypothetical protein